MQRPSNHSRRGNTILELMLAFGIMTTILLATFTVITRNTQLAHSTLGIAIAEMKAQQMLRKIEGEMANARGAQPIASLTANVGANDTARMLVDSTLGFPPEGMLLLERGTNNEERLEYSRLSGGQDRFIGLLRGLQCTLASNHSSGMGDLVRWAGLATPIELQVNPAPHLWDGRSLESTGPVFFQGDGTGFSYRVPVDPTNSIPPNYLDGNDLMWGQTINGVPSREAWACLYFQAKTTFDEASTGSDINGDGDAIDLFDIGQIRRRIWDTSNPANAPQDLGLGPTNILQERCNWGGDLNNDGFDDPLFLWDPSNRQLHMRLMILGRTNSDLPITRSVDSIVYLRNQPDI
jgi:hypothetical protein